MMTWKVELNIPLSTRAHEARVLFQPIKPELSPCYPHLNQDLLPTFSICLSISLSPSQSGYHFLNLPLNLVIISHTLSISLSVSLSLSFSVSFSLSVSLSVSVSLCTLPLAHALYSHCRSASSVWNHKVCLLISIFV